MLGFCLGEGKVPRFIFAGRCRSWPGRARAQTYAVLHDFTGPSSTSTDRSWPQSLMIDSSGNLYGVGVYGGDASSNYTNEAGTVFELANSSGREDSLQLYRRRRG